MPPEVSKLHERGEFALAAIDRLFADMLNIRVLPVAICRAVSSYVTVPPILRNSLLGHASRNRGNRLSSVGPVNKRNLDRRHNCETIGCTIFHNSEVAPHR